MEENNINQKNILTANQLIGEFLLSITIYGIIFYVLYYIAINLIKNYIDNNYTMLAFIIIAMQAIIAFAIFKLSNKRALKKGKIYKRDVSKVITSISFVIIILIIIVGLSIFSNVDNAINEFIEKDSELQLYREEFLSYIYGEEKMEIYKAEREKEIKEAKKQVYEFAAIVEIGICIIYASALILEKKSLYNKAI